MYLTGNQGPAPLRAAATCPWFRATGRYCSGNPGRARGFLRCPCGRRRGVTLIELITVLSVLSLLGVMLTSMFGSMDQSYRMMSASRDMYQTARVTLARMSREISGTLLDNASPSPLGLKGAPGEISFHTTIESDSLTADEESSDIVAIRYALGGEDGANLTRFLENSTAAAFPPLPPASAEGQILAERITKVQFNYFKSASDFYGGGAKSEWDSSPAVDNALPALVEVQITVEDRKKFSSPKTFQTLVYLRNAQT